MAIENLDELWIGDKVRSVKDGRIGSYLGKSINGTAKIKYGKEVITMHPSELELVKEEDETSFDMLDWLEEPHGVPAQKSKNTTFSAEIDLHFNDAKRGALTPQQVLDHQLESCKKHIETAISRKMNRIVIIHGKGEGILRHLVHQLLENYREVQWKMIINQGGATEVIFYYR